MARFRFSPFAALAGLLLLFSSCERHHPGELPELQRENLNPLEHPKESGAAEPPPGISATPANFFPNQKP